MEQFVLALVVTPVTAFAVLVGGQAVIRLVLEPIQELQKIRGEVAHALIYYANVPRGSEEADRKRQEEAERELRRLAAKVRVQAYVIPMHRWWAGLGLIHSSDVLHEASGELIGMSNSLRRPEDVMLTEQFRFNAAECLGVNRFVRAQNPRRPLPAQEGPQLDEGN